MITEMREGMLKAEEGFLILLLYSNGSVSIKDLYEMPGYMLSKYQKELETKVKNSHSMF